MGNLDHVPDIVSSEKTDRLIEVTSDPGRALRGRSEVLWQALRVDKISDQSRAIVSQLTDLAFELGRIYGKPTR